MSSFAEDDPDDDSIWLRQWQTSMQQLFSSSVTSNQYCEDTIGIECLSISSAEVLRSFMSKYVVYNIQITSPSYYVARRFNDFRWFHETLSKAYTGLFIPALPTISMTMAKNSDASRTDTRSDFVRNRIIQLNIFLQQLLRIPFLRTHPAWHLFFSASKSSSDFKAFTTQQEQLEKQQHKSESGGRSGATYKDETSDGGDISIPVATIADNNDDDDDINSYCNNNNKNNNAHTADADTYSTLGRKSVANYMPSSNSGSSTRKNPGFEMWRNMCETNISDLSPGERDGRVVDFKCQLQVLHKALVSVEHRCRRMTAKSIKNANAVIQFAEQLNDWQTVEQSLHDESRVVFLNEKGDELLLLMRSLALGAGHWAYNSVFVPKTIGQLILCNVQYLVDQTVGMMEHLKKHDSLLLSLEKAEKALNNAIVQRDDAVNREEKEEERAAAAAAAAGGTVSSNRRKSFRSYFTKPAVDLEPVVERKANIVRRYREDVSLSTKALLFCEMQRFSRERTKLLKYTLNAASATVHQILDCCVSDCTEVIDMAHVDCAAFSSIYLDIAQHVEQGTDMGCGGGGDDGDSDHAGSEAGGGGGGGGAAASNAIVDRVLGHSRAARASRAAEREGVSCKKHSSSRTASLTAAATAAGYLGTGAGAGAGAGAVGSSSSSRRSKGSTRECHVCTKRVQRSVGLECCSQIKPDLAPSEHPLTGFMTARHFMCDGCFAGNYMDYQLSEEYRDQFVEHNCQIVCLQCGPTVTAYKVSDLAKHVDEATFEKYMKVCQTVRELSVENKAREYAVELAKVEKERLLEETMCVVCYERQSDAILIHNGSGHVCCCYDCAQQVYQARGTCPMCRLHIDSVVRHYFTSPLTNNPH